MDYEDIKSIINKFNWIKELSKKDLLKEFAKLSKEDLIGILIYKKITESL